MDLLVAYASMVGLLAQAQLDGRLHIRPARVVAASEPLTAPARQAVQAAWGESVVIDSYAATETASIASTCSQGGWHLCEDFVIVEPVTEDYRPVPVGVTADKVLVTVLFSRTLPLIRYELTDSIRLSEKRCACGLPFALLEAVEGRTEDTSRWPGFTARYASTPTSSTTLWRPLRRTGGRSSSSRPDCWFASSPPPRTRSWSVDASWMPWPTSASRPWRSTWSP